MRVVHIVTHAGLGGAARAADRIAQAQRGIGMQATLLAAANPFAEPYVDTWFQPPAQHLKVKAMMAREVLPVWWHTRNRKRAFQFSRCATGLPLHKHPAVLAADVIHLHWFQQGFLSLQGLLQLASLGKPLVWTLHDMWGFTGGCHYNGDCQRYLQACGACPLFPTTVEHDLSAQYFQRKAALYARLSMQLVAPSKWLQQSAVHSPLMQAFDCQVIPYPIDTTAQFVPRAAEAMRAKWQLPAQAKLVFYAAFSLSDPRKGAQFLPQVMDTLRTQWPDVTLVTIGREALQMPEHKVVHLGYRSQAQEIAELFAACDATVVPSIQDNLPNVVLESLACGTPVAAFPIGGMPDMVHDGQTGFLAHGLDAPALAQALLHVLEHTTTLRASARAFAMHTFSEGTVAAAYRSLYQSKLA